VYEFVKQAGFLSVIVLTAKAVFGRLRQKPLAA